MEITHRVYKMLKSSEIKTSPIEDRLYRVDESFRPCSVEHPLIKRWLESTVPYQTSGIEKLDEATRRSFCKMCVLSLLSQIKEKRSLVHNPSVWFSPTETLQTVTITRIRAHKVTRPPISLWLKFDLE